MPVNIPDGWKITTGNWNTDATTISSPSGIKALTNNAYIVGSWIPLNSVSALFNRSYVLTTIFDLPAVTGTFQLKFVTYNASKSTVITTTYIANKTNPFGSTGVQLSVTINPGSTEIWGRFEIQMTTNSVIYYTSAQRIPSSASFFNSGLVVAPNTWTPLAHTTTDFLAECTLGGVNNLNIPRGGRYLLNGHVTFASGATTATTLIQLQFVLTPSNSPIKTFFCGGNGTGSDTKQFTYLIDQPAVYWNGGSDFGQAALQLQVQHNAAGNLTTGSLSGFQAVYLGPL